jgi:WD40 repeat protein
VPQRWLWSGLLALSLAGAAATPVGAARPEEAPILRLKGGPNTLVTSLAFSPDGRRLYAGGYDKVVHVWTLDEERGFVPSPLVHRIPIHPGTSGVINAIAVSPDGRWLAIGGQGVFCTEGAYEQGARFGSIDELPLAERQDRGLIHVLELEPDTGEEKAHFVLRKHEAPIRSLVFAPTPRGRRPLLVSVSVEPERRPDKGRVCLWDVEAASVAYKPDREARPLAEREFTGIDLKNCPVIAIQENGPGQVQIALAWNDHKVRVWDVAAKLERVLGKPDDPDRVNSTVVHLPGTGWVSGGGVKFRGTFSGHLQSWSDAAGQESSRQGGPILLTGPAPSAVQVPAAAALVPGPGKQVLVIVRPLRPPYDFRFRLVDLETGTAAAPQPGWTGDPMKPVMKPVLAVSPTGRHFAVADGTSAQVRVYSLAATAGGGAWPVQLLTGPFSPIVKVAFMKHPDRPTPGLWLRGESPDGKPAEYLLDCSQRQLVADPATMGWELDSPRTQWRSLPTGDPSRVDVEWREPEGSLHRVRLVLPPAREVVSEVAVVPPWKGSKQPTRLLAVATTARATGDPELMLCDAETGRKVRTLLSHSLPITSLRASSDGRYLASASEDCTVCVWSLLDLDEVVGQRGAPDGFGVLDTGGKIVVNAVDPSEPAGMTLQMGDALRAVAFEEKGEGQKIESPRALAEALWRVRPGRAYWLDVERAGAAARVRLETVQGADTRKPLLTLLTSRLGTDSPEWIAWTTSGFYDRRGRAIESAVGWHFNPDRLAASIKVGALKDYDRFREPALLEPLLKHGKLADAQEEIQEHIPQPKPRVVLLDPADVAPDALGHHLVRKPTVKVGLSLNPDLREAEIDSVRLLVNDTEEPLEAAQVAGDGQERTLPLQKPGVYAIRLVARTKNPAQKAESAVLQVRYQRERPRVQVLSPKDEQVTVLDRQFRFAARVRAEGKAIVWLFQDGKEVLKQEVKGNAEVVANLALEEQSNRLRLIVQNADALKGFAADERTEVRREVVVDKVAPVKVTARLLYDYRDLGAKGKEPRTVPVPGEDSEVLDLPVPTYHLQAEVTGAEDLAQVTLDGQSVRWEGKRATVTKEDTLGQVNQEKEWVLRARTKHTELRTLRVKVRYRPRLPRLEVEELAQTQYRERANHKPPDIVLRGWWTLPDEFHPFRIRVTVNGRERRVVKVDARPGTDKEFILEPLPLEPGSNDVRVVLKNDWDEKEVARLHPDWLRTPVVVGDRPRLAKPTRRANENAAETELTAEVDSPADFPLTDIRIDNGGAPYRKLIDLARLPGKDVGGGIKRWTIAVPGLPVQLGDNPISLVVANKAGSTRARETVSCPIDARVPLPLILAEPEVAVGHRQHTLTFRVHSIGSRLTGVWVVGAQEEGREEKVAFKADEPPFGPPADRHWSYQLTHPLRLTQKKRRITIRAENMGGEARPVQVLVSYVPQPPQLHVLEGLPDGAAPLPLLRLTGRVEWSEDDDEDTIERGRQLVEKGLRAYVNDFRQLRPEFESARGGKRGVEFTVKVVLNQPQNNAVKFTCPGLPLEGAVLRPLACDRPQRAALHLLVVDVDGVVGEGELVKRVRLGLRLPEPNQPFRSSVFRAWKSYDGTEQIVPLTQKNVNALGIESVAGQMRRRIADSASPTDMLLIYWVGPEARDREGKPVLPWAAGSRPIPVARLLGAEGPGEPQLLGARVLLLDVPEGRGEKYDATTVWENDEHAAIIRYSWDRDRKLPAGLLEAMEKVAAGGRITLRRIAQQAENQAEKHQRPPGEHVDHNLDVLTGLAGILFGGR